MKFKEILAVLLLFGWIPSWIAWVYTFLTVGATALLTIQGILTLVGLIIWLLANIAWSVFTVIIMVWGGE